MQGLVLGDLTIDFEEVSGSRVALHWKGASNSRDPQSGLRSFFGLALAECAAGSKVLEMHFEALNHFNSSTIAAVLRFVEDARTKAVKVELFYDPSLRWQAHTFVAMKALAKDDGLLKINPLGSAPAKEKIGPG